MQTATADPLVGRLLEGRYRIRDRIARGGMSTVYAAVDERLDRLVAVKVMSSLLSADPAFTDRFAREARAAARLTHVNAVAVYDQGIDRANGSGSGHVFLVMELVEGRTLRDLIRERNGRFTPAEAISILEPVLAALASAHRAGLVHRDIKPENILLSDAGVVKVADFGLARAIDAESTSTRTGLMMGTVAYCAPEQISRGYADPRSDVYAAGIVLFELLTGRPPYQGASALNVAYQHVHSRVPAPSSRVKGVPEEIDELVIGATDSDPTGRPSDAAAFVAELADVRVALALPITPVPVRRRPPLTPEPRRSGRTPRASAGRTDVLGNRGAQHDTRVVPDPGGRPPRDDDAPPPPVVIPPPRPRKQVSPRARRRRHNVAIALIVLLVGAVSLVGGYVGTHWYQHWNSHVPNLVKVSLTAAEKRLAQDNYRLGRVSNQFSETVPQGSIISTDPVSGDRLEEGKAIDVTVSLGQDRLVVPDVAHLRIDLAEAQLHTRGIQFEANVTYRSSTSVKSGNVISTDPPGGSKIKRSATVSFVVSSGPPILDIPTVAQGTSYDDAKAALTAAKFRVVRTDEFDDNVPADSVISVSPSGQAPQGSKVTVAVSKGPEFVTVPAISALSSYDDAKAQLEALGLSVERRVVYGQGDRNVVVGQNPDPGQSVRSGTTVVLAVI